MAGSKRIGGRVRNSPLRAYMFLPVFGGKDIPKSISGLKFWLDAEDKSTLYQDNALTTPVAADGDVVGGWRDKATGVNKASQATANQKPLYKTAIQNGKAGILFDGANDRLSLTTNPALDGAVTAIVVMTVVENGTAVEAFYLQNSVGNKYALQMRGDCGANSYAVMVYDTAERSVSYMGDPVGGAAIIGLSNIEGSVINLYRNGILGAGVVNTLEWVNFGTVSYIGAWSNGTTFPFNGYIHEMLVYDRVLTDAELKILWGYLGTKWKIATVVPAKGSPCALPNCTLWLDVSQMNALDSALIHVLPDISGNGSHGVQATLTKQGLFKTAILNGLPGILMDNVNDYFYLDKAVPAASECTVFGVFTVEDHAATARPLLWGFTDPGAAPYVNQGFYGPTSAVAGGDRDVATTVGWDGAAKESKLNVVAIGSHIFGSTEKESDFITVYFDNSVGAPTAVGAAFTTPYGGKGVVGANMDGLSRWMKGYIHELIAWDRVLTTAEIAVVKSYLAAKWGITL